MADSVSDASAIIAFLRHEPGAERVAKALARTVVSAVNLSEIVAWLSRSGLKDTEIRQTVNDLDLDVSPFDAELAVSAGLLSRATQPFGLSFGDRACLALAQRLAVPVLTTDGIWSTLRVGVKVELIR